jgi:hypothetical protein
MKFLPARSLLVIAATLSASVGALVACSSSSTTTSNNTDSGVSTVRADGGSGGGGDSSTGGNTDSGSGGGTDSGSGDTDSGVTVPQDGVVGDPCTGSGAQGSCGTGELCETFPNKSGDFCTLPCTMPGVDPDSECQDAGASVTGKCTPKSYCQLQ